MSEWPSQQSRPDASPEDLRGPLCDKPLFVHNVDFGTRNLINSDALACFANYPRSSPTAQAAGWPTTPHLRSISPKSRYARTRITSGVITAGLTPRPHDWRWARPNECCLPEGGGAATPHRRHAILERGELTVRSSAIGGASIRPDGIRRNRLIGTFSASTCDL
jgi:hypothetical protein